MNNVTFRCRGKVATRGEASPLLFEPGDAVLVVRGRPRVLVMACPCGCRSRVVVNLDPRAGPAWRLYQCRRGTSLYPSVVRESGCRSHFVVWNDRILTMTNDLAALSTMGAATEARVCAYMMRGTAAHFADVAEAIGLVPWTVLSVLQSFVRRGVVRETGLPGVFQAGSSCIQE